MRCFSVAKLPQARQPNWWLKGTLQSRTYWLVSNSLILCYIPGSLFRGFTCVVRKDIMRREYFLSELLCEEQRQSVALGGRELSVGFGYRWSWGVVGGVRDGFLPPPQLSWFSSNGRMGDEDSGFLLLLCFHLVWFCLQREQGLNGVCCILPSSVNCWLRLLLPLSLPTQESVRALPQYHDRQTCICNESVLRHSSCLHLRKLSGHICSLMLSFFWSLRNLFASF